MGIQERKQREKELRRQQILNAAKKIFSQKGFSNATMEEIAGEAELSPGTLYLYFKNKEELYASLSLMILEFLSDNVDRINSDENLDPLDRLNQLIDAMYDVYDFDHILIISLLHLQSSETLDKLSPALMTELTELSYKSTRAVTKVFESGIQKGVFSGYHPVALADIFWSLFSGIVLCESSKKYFDEDKDHLKNTLKIAFEIFSKGIIIQQGEAPVSRKKGLISRDRSRLLTKICCLTDSDELK